MDAPFRVRFDGIGKSYPGVCALRDVSFGVRAGCVHALVGENGAGKSTLMKILAGAVQPDEGQIEIDRQVADLHDARAAQRAGVAIVYQEFNLVADLTVAENVYLGRWPRRSVTGLIHYDELNEQASRLVGQLGLDLPVRSQAGRLGLAQQQMVEIAKALSLSAKVLILDEPSAVLTPQELAALFRLVRELTSQGVSVIYISHRLDEIFELADFVTVLRDGQHISTRPIHEVDRRQLIAECVGRPLEDEFPRRSVSLGEPVLRVESLSVKGWFEDVSLEVRSGEVFALTGLVGSGRSSVARAIFGAMPSVRGMVQVGSMHGPFASPRAAKRAGVAMVPEDRRREGLLWARTVRENITLAHLAKASCMGFMRRTLERRLTGQTMSELRIRAESREAAVATLSGGNQQKTMLARWLLRPCRVMILDEPTRGVDVGAKAEIYRIINDLAGQGLVVLLISSELPEVIGMADRIGVMCGGRLAGILSNEHRQMSQETIMHLAVGAGIL